MPMNRKASTLLISIFLLSAAASLFQHSNITSNVTTRIESVNRASTESILTCMGNRQSMMLDGYQLFQNTSINFSYIPAGGTSARVFADSSILVHSTNSTFSDNRGTGVRYDLEYNNTDALLVEEVRMYPSLGAMLLNASLIPERNFNFSGSEFDLITCERSNVLPFMVQDSMLLSYFDGVDIWGSFAVKPVKTSNISYARTPVLLHDDTIGMLIGAVTSEHFESEVKLQGSSFAIKMPIVAGYKAFNQTIIPLETCWIQLGSNFSSLFLSYAQQVRSFNPPVRLKTVDNFFATSAGTCDWASRYGNINESTVSADMDRLISVHDSGYSFYIMDSGWGYDNTTGRDFNWSTWNAQKFPNGISATVTKAHDAGIKFVLWNRIAFAPVWVQQHHYWWVATWNGYVVMNLSQAVVQDYMANVFATWHAEGIDGLKIDFIADSVDQYAWDANVWNLDKTRAELMNQYFDLLDRFASIYNLPVDLCGTPIGYPSLARYPNLVASRVTGDSGYQGVYPDWQVSTALLRSFWWNAAFNTPDPDAYKTSDLRSVMVAASIGGALYYGEINPGFVVLNAGHARVLHWDVPAVPDNIAYNGKCIIARGAWHGNRAVISLNLDNTRSYEYDLDGITDQSSIFRMTSPADGIFATSACIIDGFSGKYDVILKPGYTSLQIIYQGQPPFPVQAFAGLETLQISIGLVIPVGLLFMAFLVNFRKIIQQIRRKTANA